MLFFLLLFIGFYPAWVGHWGERNYIFQEGAYKTKFTWLPGLVSFTLRRRKSKKECESGCCALLLSGLAHQSEQGGSVSVRKAPGIIASAGLWATGESQMVLLQPEELPSRKFWAVQEFLRVIPGSAKSS